ncbi:hypothetical protein XENORESO_020691 [Xenotaenia resolanae]|uniref:Uncharacterized protein n=1 Tax=Xenotaenia resolanae TaxID=208358 RepID=A0ABV0WZP0_9TELE
MFIQSFYFYFKFLIICPFCFSFFFLCLHSNTVFSYCGRCLCRKLRSDSPSDGAYWMEPSNYTVPYTCPACQKLEQDEFNQQSQLQQEPQHQCAAPLQQPPSSQHHLQLEQSQPPAHFETLIT